MKKILFFALLAPHILMASEPPAQLEMGLQTTASVDTRRTQIFDECSNEECAQYCLTTRDVITDPIVPFIFCGEIATHQFFNVPYGCAALGTASLYLACQMCFEDPMFSEDYSAKAALLLKQKLIDQGSKIFPCIVSKKKKTE